MEELIYNILAYLIVGGALFVAGKRIYQKIRPQTDTGCSSGCGGCASVECQVRDLVQKQ